MKLTPQATVTEKKSATRKRRRAVSWIRSWDSNPRVNVLKKITLEWDLQWKKVKVKFSRYRPGVAQRVGRAIALLFHDRGTRRGWVVSSTPRPHFTPGKDPVPILQEAGWAPGDGLVGKMYSFTFSLTSALVKRPGTHCIAGWVGPRPGLDGCGKSRPSTGIRSRTVQPVVSRYTDWATRPTHYYKCRLHKSSCKVRVILVIF